MLNEHVTKYVLPEPEFYSDRRRRQHVHPTETVIERLETTSGAAELMEPAASVTTHRTLPEDADGYLIVGDETELKEPVASDTTPVHRLKMPMVI